MSTGSDETLASVVAEVWMPSLTVRLKRARAMSYRAEMRDGENVAVNAVHVLKTIRNTHPTNTIAVPANRGRISLAGVGCQHVDRTALVSS